jgi:hypothetical protein
VKSVFSVGEGVRMGIEHYASVVESTWQATDVDRDQANDAIAVVPTIGRVRVESGDVKASRNCGNQVGMGSIEVVLRTSGKVSHETCRFQDQHQVSNFEQHGGAIFLELECVLIWGRHTDGHNFAADLNIVGWSWVIERDERIELKLT